MIDYLNRLVRELAEHGLTADLAFPPKEGIPKGSNEYLIRFCDWEGRGQCLLLMGDLGLTWEPARAWHTEQLGSITGENLEEDIQEMVKVAEKYYDGELNKSPEAVAACRAYNGKNPGY